VVEAERLDLDHDVARHRCRIGPLAQDQLFGTAVLLDDHRAHDILPRCDVDLRAV
jgi:hypothetical protein